MLRRRIALFFVDDDAPFTRARSAPASPSGQAVTATIVDSVVIVDVDGAGVEAFVVVNGTEASVEPVGVTVEAHPSAIILDVGAVGVSVTIEQQGAIVSDFYIKQGDTLPVLTATATNDDGSPLDVTGAAVTFRMRNKTGAGFVIEAPADIVDAAAGVLQWADWTTTQTAEPGVYFADFLVVFAGGGRQTVPTKTSIVVRVIGATAGDCEA